MISGIFSTRHKLLFQLKVFGTGYTGPLLQEQWGRVKQNVWINADKIKHCVKMRSHSNGINKQQYIVLQNTQLQDVKIIISCYDIRSDI